MAEPVSTNTIEQLIRDLNDPRNQASPEAVDLVQRKIQRLQRESSAWQIGLALLHHNEALMRFYGALTLTIKINADWDTDKVGQDRNLIKSLLEQLISNFIRLAAIPDATFVLRKLCTTLVAVFQRSDSAWAFPLRHLLACTIAGYYIQQETVPELPILLGSSALISSYQLRSILMFALTLAEEASNPISSSSLHNIDVRFSNNAQDVWQILRYCVVVHDQANPTSLSHDRYQLILEGTESQPIAKAVITLIPHWTQFVKLDKRDIVADEFSIVECFQGCLEALHFFFEDPELSLDTLQTWTALEQNHHRLLHQISPSYARNIVESRHATQMIDQLLEGDFDSEPVSYVEFLEALMTQVDVTSPKYLEETAYALALGQLSKLLRCKGIAGVDDNVCSIALEVLTSIAEGFGDWDDKTIYGNEVLSLISTASIDSLAKIEFPSSELNPATKTWDTDDQAKFQDFRYDVQDFLQNAFTITGAALIQEIIQQVISVEKLKQWSKFEANLFGLVAFSDTINGDPEQFDQYLEILFECDNWRIALHDSSTPERVRKIMIKVIGENTAYLERHQQKLGSSLDFLFQSLHITTSATSASRAIFTLCDTQRTALSGALPQFISSLSTVLNLDSDSKSRVFGGVSAIVQGLSSENAKLQPLSDILDFIEDDVRVVMSSNIPLEILKVKATDIVWTLATIGKGLRTPSDITVDLEVSPSNAVDFWTCGNGKVIQQRVLAIYDILRQKTEGETDSLFVEATCDLLRSAFTENHPSPLKFDKSIILTILDRHISLTSPQPEIVLGTATSFLASIATASSESEFTKLLAIVLTACQHVLNLTEERTITAQTDFCSAAIEFFGRLLPRWSHVWLELPDAEDSAQIIVNLALKMFQDSDTLPRRAAAGFFTALFDAGKVGQAFAQKQGDLKWSQILQSQAPRIVANIFHLIGGECARSELESLTEPIKRFVQRQPLLANRLIKEAVKAENHVLSEKALDATRPEQRARFASQIEMLRGARKTNDVVKEFWISCRGNSFGYVT